MFCLARFCSKASVVGEKPASLHVRRRLIALIAHFFLRLRDQVETYIATAQFASPLIRITSVLTPPLPRIPRLPRIFSGRLNRRSQAQLASQS
jgi:hypothetical protein